MPGWAESDRSRWPTSPPSPSPTTVGDFGSGAVTLMGPTDVFAVLFEYGPESLGTALFGRQGMVGGLTADDFRPTVLRRGLGGQCGTQWFFTEASRPFTFYAVLGQPGPAGQPGPEGQRPSRRDQRRHGGRQRGRGGSRGTDRAVPGGLRPAGDRRGGQGPATGRHGPGAPAADDAEGTARRGHRGTRCRRGPPPDRPPAPRDAISGPGRGRRRGGARCGGPGGAEDRDRRGGGGLLSGLRRGGGAGHGPGRSAGHLRLLRTPGHPTHRRPPGGRTWCWPRRRRRWRSRPRSTGDGGRGAGPPTVARRAPGDGGAARHLAGHAGAGPTVGTRGGPPAGRRRGRRGPDGDHPRRPGVGIPGLQAVAAELHQPGRLRRQRGGGRQRPRPDAASPGPPTGPSAAAATRTAGAAPPAARASPTSAARSTAGTTTARPAR